eukprot:2544931-Rhodomonas_salina.1
MLTFFPGRESHFVQGNCPQRPRALERTALACDEDQRNLKAASATGAKLCHSGWHYQPGSRRRSARWQCSVTVAVGLPVGLTN